VKEFLKMRSKFTILSGLAWSGFALALVCSPALQGQLAPGQSGPQKFAIINMQEALLSTKDGKQAVIDLKAKFAPKEQEFQKRTEELQRKQDELRKTENTISEEKKAALAREIDSITKALQRDTDDAREDVNQEQQKVLNELGMKIMQVLNKYASEKGYTMVFDVSGQPNNILFATNSIDVTHDIIALYDTTAPASFSAPAGKAPAASPTSVKRPAAPAPAASTPAAPAAH
jgi:outer membrane protein